MRVTCDLTERQEAENAFFLGLSNSLLSNLDGNQLLSAISESIQRVVPCDLTTLGLYDPETNQIQLQKLDGSGGGDLLDRAVLAPIEGSVLGRVFTSREPLLMSSIQPEQLLSQDIRYFVDAGINSVCGVPLVGRERAVGVLALGGRQETAFNHKHLRLLGQLANHVAVALENALAFRKIKEARDRLAWKSGIWRKSSWANTRAETLWAQAENS